MRKLVSIIMLVALVSALPAGTATPADNHDAVADGADRLLDIQADFGADGALPWIVGQPGVYQNVQGITAQAFLDAYTLTLDEDYLGTATTGAQGVRNWLEANMTESPGYTSAPNVYFLAEYALLTGETADLELARTGLAGAIEDSRWDDTPEALAEFIIDWRANGNAAYTNLGLWDVALFARAAQDVGATDAADAFASVLYDQADNQTLVDPFNASAGSYVMGLSGLLFGLAESDLVAHQALLADVADLIKTEQAADGSFGSVQDTAFAVLGLTSILDVTAEAQDGCDFLVAAQDTRFGAFNFGGGWDVDGTEYAEMNSEAVQALASCVAPLHNGVVAETDAVRALL